MAAKRIYVVTCSATQPPQRLVRAASAAQAIKHVTKPDFNAEVATQDDLIALAKTCDVEEAGE